MGNFIAWDAATGKIVWSNKEQFSVWSGALATAGDVVFYGTLEGYLKAVDAKTGKELYKFKTPSGIIGNVMTYSHKGKQYVAVLSGVGGWAGIGLAAGLTESDGGPWRCRRLRGPEGVHGPRRSADGVYAAAVTGVRRHEPARGFRFALAFAVSGCLSRGRDGCENFVFRRKRVACQVENRRRIRNDAARSDRLRQEMLSPKERSRRARRTASISTPTARRPTISSLTGPLIGTPTRASVATTPSAMCATVRTAKARPMRPRSPVP